MYADRRELLVFRTFSTVSQRAEKVFRHAERDGKRRPAVFYCGEAKIPSDGAAKEKTTKNAP